MSAVAFVSMRTDFIADRKEYRDALDQKLVSWLAAAGFATMAIANNPNNLQLLLEKVTPHLVVLSGGNNIGDVIERDKTEAMLLEYAALQKTPLLGICRGMQMMAARAGIALCPVVGHVGQTHLLQGKIAGQRVNSYHHLALSALPADYDLLATSEDGSIEAIAHQTLPWQGWMWHPEREAEFAAADIRRLQELVANG